MHFLFLAFLKLSKVEMFFQKQDLYTWMKGKNRPDNQLTQTGRVVTNFFWNEENHDSNREILRKAIYVHLHKRKLLSSSTGLCFFCWILFTAHIVINFIILL